MQILNRLILIVIVMLAVACQGGVSGGSGHEGDENDEEGEQAEELEAGAGINGDYVGIEDFVTSIRVVSLGSNTPPVEEDCQGDIELIVDDGAPAEIVGSGRCTLLNNANFADYEVDAAFISDTEFEGEIRILFSRVTHVLEVSGTLEDEEINASFAGRTVQTTRLVIDWDGEFSAELESD